MFNVFKCTTKVWNHVVAGGILFSITKTTVKKPYFLMVSAMVEKLLTIFIKYRIE